MGIKNLMKFLHDNAPRAITERSVEQFSGTTVAIDASMSLYQFLAAIRSAADDRFSNLTNDAGEITSHISGFLSRTIRMFENGIRPVYVFDGKPPEIKKGELYERAEKKKQAEAELQAAVEAGDSEAIKKAATRTIKGTKKMNDDVKKLLRMMGCPCVDAPSEAEATCARLASAGKVDYAVTEDMDVLTFGTPKMLKNMFDTESSRTGTKRPVYEIDLAIVLEQLGVSMQQFVDFCILCGCDYLESIRGCGPATAFKLVVQHESIEGIAKALQQQPLARMQIPDNWEFAAARNFFLEPEVVDSNEVSVDLSEPDYEGLESWLVQEHQFNPERVTRYIDRLKKARKKKKQARLDNFFKPKPQARPSVASPTAADKYRSPGGRGGKTRGSSRPKTVSVRTDSVAHTARGSERGGRTIQVQRPASSVGRSHSTAAAAAAPKTVQKEKIGVSASSSIKSQDRRQIVCADEAVDCVLHDGSGWTCATCTYQNSPTAEQCIMCGSAHPALDTDGETEQEADLETDGHTAVDSTFDGLRDDLTAVFTEYAGGAVDGGLQLRYSDVNRFNIASGIPPNTREDFERLAGGSGLGISLDKFLEFMRDLAHHNLAELQRILSCHRPSPQTEIEEREMVDEVDDGAGTDDTVEVSDSDETVQMSDDDVERRLRWHASENVGSADSCVDIGATRDGADRVQTTARESDTATIAAILGIERGRASRLLESLGNVEAAIEYYYADQEKTGDTERSPTCTAVAISPEVIPSTGVQTASAKPTIVSQRSTENGQRSRSKVTSQLPQDDFDVAMAAFEEAFHDEAVTCSTSCGHESGEKHAEGLKRSMGKSATKRHRDDFDADSPHTDKDVPAEQSERSFEQAERAAKRQHVLGLAPLPDQRSAEEEKRAALPLANARWIAAHASDLDSVSDMADVTPASSSAPTTASAGLGSPVWEYDPIKSACWQLGEAVPYCHLAECFQVVESTTKRLLITATLCNTFRSLIALSPDDLLPALYLCIDKLGPPYTQHPSKEVGHSIIVRALKEATGSDLKKWGRSLGDLGDVAVAVRSSQRTLGGLGKTAKPLTVRSVFGALQAIARESGQGSQDRKKECIKKILVAAKGVETKYIVRTLEANLRVGATLKTVLVALAQAVVLTPPSACVHSGNPQMRRLDALVSPTDRAAFERDMVAASVALRAAWDRHPDLDHLVAALLDTRFVHGWRALQGLCPVTVGIPVEPMLGQITSSFAAMAQQAATGRAFACEVKYDGQRAQIHRRGSDGRVFIFSRHLQDNTDRFADVAALFEDCSGAHIGSNLDKHSTEDGAGSCPNNTNNTSDISCSGARHSQQLRYPAEFVIDAELVAVDRANPSRLLPMQQLGTAASRSAVPLSTSTNSLDVGVCIFAFDLLVSDGEVLLDKPLVERRSLLRQSFSPKSGVFQFVQSEDVGDDVARGEQSQAHVDGNACEDPLAERSDGDGEEKRAALIAARVKRLCQEAVESGGEGLMVKALTGDNATYCPAKRSENAWIKLKKDYLVAEGKAGWISPFLMAAYDPEHEEYVAFCKVMTGFTDVQYRDFTRRFTEKALPQGCKPRHYRVPAEYEGAPFWFRGDTVWEMQGAELTVSPTYGVGAGLVDDGGSAPNNLDGENSRGLSLRFPRFIRERPDKVPEAATSVDQLVAIYNAQSRRVGSSAIIGAQDTES